ncbi:MAG: dTMP kinase [Spirochaetes bacterium GWF1_51_8]|nr:MAG: dTMP kinase [Spirochaetes bacterium GWF1_51_8]
MDGIFITFEGIEACGKSTQANILYNLLESRRIKTILTKEPGGTELGDKIRNIVLHEKVFPVAELLLFLADRNQHINETIRPYMNEGYVVICDRFYHSTYAYQATGRKIGLDIVRRFNEMIIEDCRPDLTFLIDLPPEVGFERKRTANLALDRIEKQDYSFHNSVREAYLELAKADKTIRVLDGMHSKDTLTKEIMDILNGKFPALERQINS